MMYASNSESEYDIYVPKNQWITGMTRAEALRCPSRRIVYINDQRTGTSRQGQVLMDDCDIGNWSEPQRTERFKSENPPWKGDRPWYQKSKRDRR